MLELSEQSTSAYELKMSIFARVRGRVEMRLVEFCYIEINYVELIKKSNLIGSLRLINRYSRSIKRSYERVLFSRYCSTAMLLRVLSVSGVT